MERDALICHGASATIIDRMYTCSDKYTVFVCRRCGGLAAPGDDDNFRHERKKPWCPSCKLDGDVAPVRMPYATKLLLQELMAMHIRPELEVGPE